MASAALPGSQSAGEARNLVFISYSHSDKDWLRHVETPLKAFSGLNVWADPYIEVGGKWRRDISTALTRTCVGVLLVSPDFLASDFIRNEELPALLKDADAKSITLFPIPIRASNYKATPLAEYQFAHPPDRPLDRLRFPGRNAVFVRLAEQIAAAAQRVASVPRPQLRPERAAVVPLAPVAETGRVAILHGVPSQRPHHLRRPEYFTTLKQALLGATDQAVAITGATSRIGLHGMGGIGKTVLAIDLVNDEEIRRAFADGVFWLTFGQSIDPLQLQAELAGYLTGETKAFATEHEGRDRLRQLFEGRSCLLVLDDLWRSGDAESFDVLGPRSRLLVTTRDADLLVRLRARELSLGVPDEASALELLASFSGQTRDTLPDAARQVVESCGRLPLALAVAGAQIRGGAAWDDVLAALELGRLEFPGYGSIFNALQVSTDALAPSDRDRYLELAVFPEDADVPVEAICTLWRHTGGMAAPGSRELLRRLHRMALLIRSDDRRRISFHDLQHDFLRLNIPSLVKGHAALVDAYRATAPSGWASGPDDGYFFQQLPQHLAAADRLDEVKALLCNYDWLAAKLRATNVTTILADYDLIANDPDLTLIQQALRLSIPALVRDYSQLPIQLLGRLRGANSPAVKTLVAGAEKGPGRTWLCPRFPSLTPPGGPLRQILVGHRGTVTAVALLPDGRHALSGSSDNTLRLWDLATGETLRTLEGHTDAVNTVAVLADGSRALSGSWDNTLRLWDLATGETLRTLEAHSGSVTAVAVMTDGSHAVSGSYNNMLLLWDLATGETLRTLEGHFSQVSAVAVLADGSGVLSASFDRTLRLWNLATGETLRVLNGHSSEVSAVAVLADGSGALSGSFDRTLRLWDLTTGETLRTFTGHTFGVNAVAVLADSSRALSGSSDKTLRLWDLATGETLRTLEGHTSTVIAVAVLADGRRALSGSDDNTLRLWDLATGETLRTLEGHSDWVSAVAVLADGSRVVSGSWDDTLRLWDLATGETLRVFKGHTSRVSAVAVLADGRRAVSGSDDNTLRLWDLATGETRRTLKGHTGGVTAAAVLPDGSRALSGSSDSSLRLWDLATGECLAEFVADARVTCVAFAWDDLIVAGSADGRIHVLEIREP